MCEITIGERIKYYRKLLGISQSYLASGNYSVKYIQSIESNKRRLNPATASIIADKLNRVAMDKGINLGLTLDELYMPGDQYIEMICLNKLKECEKKDNYIKEYFDTLQIAEKYSVHSIMIKVYGELSTYYHRMGDYNLALDYTKNKLLICYELDLSNEIAVCLNTIGVFYYIQKDYDKAISYYSKGYEFTKVKNLKDSLIYVKLVYNIALTYSIMNKLEEAIKYLKILNDVKDISEPYRTNGLILNGNLLVELENYEEALKIFEDLICDHSENIYIIQHNMGLIFSKIGKLDDSIKCYTESINDQLKEPTADMTISLINIAKVYELESDEKIAIIFIEYAIKNAICFKQSDYILMCFDIIKELYYKSKQKEKLCNFFDNIISLYEQKFSDLKILGTIQSYKKIFL